MIKFACLFFFALFMLAFRTQATDFYFKAGGVAWVSLSECTSHSQPCKSDSSTTVSFPANSTVHHVELGSSIFNTACDGAITQIFEPTVTGGLTMNVQGNPTIFKNSVFGGSMKLSVTGDVVFDACTVLSGVSWDGSGTNQMTVIVQNSVYELGALPDFTLQASTAMLSYTIFNTTIRQSATFSTASDIKNLTFDQVTLGASAGQTFWLETAKDYVIVRNCSWALSYNYFNGIRNSKNVWIEDSHWYSLDAPNVASFSISTSGVTAKRDYNYRQNMFTSSHKLREIFEVEEALTILRTKFEMVLLDDRTAGRDGMRYDHLSVQYSSFYNSFLYACYGSNATLVNNVFSASSTFASSASLLMIDMANLHLSNNIFPSNRLTIPAVSFASSEFNSAAGIVMSGSLECLDISVGVSGRDTYLTVYGTFQSSALSCQSNTYMTLSGPAAALIVPNNGSITGTGLTLDFLGGAKMYMVVVDRFSSFTGAITNNLLFDEQELELIIPKPMTLDVLDSFTLFASFPSNWRVSSYHSTQPTFGYAGDFNNASSSLTFVISSISCTPSCLNGGSCVARDNCSCPTPWSGPVCECTTLGQVGTTVCNPRGGQIWIAPPGLAILDNENLDIPSGYLVQMEGDILNNGTITIREGTIVSSNGTLINLGNIQLSTSVVSSAAGCPTSSSIRVSNFNLDPISHMTIVIDTSNLDPSSACASTLSDPVLLAGNGSTLEGSVKVEFSGNSDTRASIAVVSSGNVSSSITSPTLLVETSSPSGTCSSVNQSPGFISVFVTPCTPKKGVKWYYWGAPVIAVVGVVAIAVTVVIFVPKIQTFFMPYKGSN